MKALTFDEVILIAGMMAVTFLARYPLMVLVGRMPLPESVFRALRYVPVAVLIAISVPPVLLPGGQLDLRPQNAQIIGALVAIGLAWRTRNLLWTIVGGMAAFFIWRALLGG